MNPNDETYVRSLSEWLRADSEHRVPDHLEAVLRRTSTQRQRPAWSSLERWLPIAIAERRSSFVQPTRLRVFAGLVVIALLIAALLALAVGSRRPLPPPYGLARNGALVSSADGDIFSIDPRTGTSSPLITGSAMDFGPMFSRDGTRLLFLRAPDVIPSPGLLIVVANSDGSSPKEITPATQGLDWVDWSPDGSRIAYLTQTPGKAGHRINIINVDGSGLMSLADGPPANQISWLPPDGKEIVFRLEHALDSDPPLGIWAIRPEGTGLRPISTRPARDPNDYNDVAVSPDGTRLAYRYITLEGGFRVHILDLRTGLEQEVPESADAVGEGGPGFSPDGTSIVYLRWYADSSTQLVVAPVDGSSTGIAIGPHGPLGSDGPTINNYGFAPDGTAVIANYDADKVAWLLPVDGSPGEVIARGELAFASYQRLAR